MLTDGGNGGPRPLAFASKMGKMTLNARGGSATGVYDGPGVVAMAASRQEAMRAQLLDQAIDRLLRGEDPLLEEDDELSALLEVARLRHRLSRFLRAVAAERQEAVWGQVLSRISPPAQSEQP